MPGTRELQRRIKSVKGTRKVTRALQLVSAAKMRRAQQATLASRSYSGSAWELIKRVASQAAIEHPLLTKPKKPGKIGVIVISTNRGMVGSFNTNLLTNILKLEQAEPKLLFELIVVGKKAKTGLTRLRKTIVAEFPKSEARADISSVYPLAELLTEQFKTGEFSKIYVVYNHFVSTLVQAVTAKQLLPLTLPAEGETKSEREYQFEPSPQLVLEHLLPRIIESQLYQAILESDASEHSARMVMMKNATDAAGDLVDDLTLTFNQLRQNKITTELSEITAGKIALE